LQNCKKIALIFIGLIFASVISFTDKLPDTFQIIPKPRKVEILKGPGLKFGGLKGIARKGDFARPVMGPILTILPGKDAGSKKILTLVLSNEKSLPESGEGYVLNIKNGRAEIKSRKEAGLFYGCQTLEQLLEDARDTGSVVPACRIMDYPDLDYRAIHIDVKHHLDTIKYYYESIDRLARYKINAIIFEFEDKLRYRRRPEVGAPQAMSIDEVAAMTRYARRRHIEISPLVQGLGHATYILKHEKYAHLREDPESRWAFCPCDEGTYEVLFDLYLDAFEATPGSRFLHVGGDEIGEIGKCPRCKPLADKEGLLTLNLLWLKRVCNFAREHDRIPIFWDDMLFKYAGVWDSMRRDEEKSELEKIWSKGEPILDSVLEQYPKNCVYMRWNYTLAHQAGNVRALEWFKSRGLQVMIATAAQNVHPLLPQDDRVNIIQSFNCLAYEKGISGMLCTAWDDSSPHMETYWRGLIASAEFSWFSRGRSLEEYGTAYLQREFGPECIDATDLYFELFKGVSFWNRALCAEGNRRNVKKIMDLPDSGNPGAWSIRHKERLTLAGKQALRYERLKLQLRDLYKKALRNRYHLKIHSAINDFQVTSAHLLLALKESDCSSTAARTSGYHNVERALESFKLAWENLKNIYAETRFLSYPEDYIPDRYFHLASKREDLSWMVGVEKKYHMLVRNWLDSN